MTLLTRATQSILRHSLQPKLTSIAEETVDAFRVLPFDIDVYRHMNHAKYLNYMEAVRWGLMARSGFLRASFEHGWIGPLASLHVDYYRPLTLGQRFEIQTRFVRFEEKWFYVVQRFWSGGRESARALAKGTVRKGKVNVPPSEYLGKLGFAASDALVPEDLEDWIEPLVTRPSRPSNHSSRSKRETEHD